MSKDRVLALLPKLKRDELQEVRAVLNNLLSQNTPITNVELWLDAIKVVLGVGFIVKTRTPKKHFDTAEEFLKRVLPEHRRVNLMAGRQRLVSLLANDLKKRKVNPTVGIIIANLGRLPEVFDNAYPGYRDSGLAWMIFARREA
jgi:hypothetical protein